MGIIDFDTAAPGPRVMDLGYAAWLWLNIGSDEFGAKEQKRLLNLFLSSYGDVNNQALFKAMLLRQKMLIFEGRRLGKTAIMNWAERCYLWTIKHFSLEKHLKGY